MIPLRPGASPALTAANGTARRPADRSRVDPDAALVERLRRRGVGAVETLVAAYADRLYRLALRLAGDRRHAEDVVRDALRTALRTIDTFGEELPFGSWLYRIVTKTAGQASRAGRDRHSEVTPYAPWQSCDGHRRQLDAATDWSPDLEEPAFQAELRTVLAAAVRELPVGDRVAFVLRDVEGLTSPEVAAVLELGPAVVRSRVHRSRLFVRKQLAAYIDARRRHRRAAIKYDE